MLFRSPLLPDFIRHANEMGFKVAITTNGSLLEKCGDSLIESGVYKVNIKLHPKVTGVLTVKVQEMK